MAVALIAPAVLTKTTLLSLSMQVVTGYQWWKKGNKTTHIKKKNHGKWWRFFGLMTNEVLVESVGPTGSNSWPPCCRALGAGSKMTGRPWQPDLACGPPPIRWNLAFYISSTCFIKCMMDWLQNFSYNFPIFLNPPEYMSFTHITVSFEQICKFVNFRLYNKFLVFIYRICQ